MDTQFLTTLSDKLKAHEFVSSEDMKTAIELARAGRFTAAVATKAKAKKEKTTSSKQLPQLDFNFLDEVIG